MSHHKIVISASSDPEALKAQLRSEMAGQVLGADVTAPIEDCIGDLYRQGSQLASLGNSFNASRQFEIGTLSVQIVAQFGPKTSITTRIRSALGL